MEKIRYGIVGFGGIAENRIAKEGFALDRCRFSNPDLPMVLIGATDLNPKRKEAALALGLKWFDSYDEMLASDSIDAIYVATSNSTHFTVAMQALESGKHVLVEKPMTTTVEDARKLCEVAQRKRLSLSVNLMMPKNIYNVKARELLQQEAVGTVEYASLHMEFLYGKDPAERATWRCASPAEVGGPIGDVGGHCLDLAEFLFEERIVSVRCVYYPKTLDIAVEDGAFIIFRLSGGLEGAIRVAFNQPRGGLFGTIDNLGYEIYGDNGVLRGHGTAFQLSGHKDEPVAIGLEVKTSDYMKSYAMTQVHNIYQAQIAEHAESIRHHKPIDGMQGLHNIALVLACHESATNGGKEVLL
ncbi:MAG: Gfo/Idh/MocA family oxidoreductase [Sphaerochaetaceae bacterium]|jgi:predicted dehydrogenase|nr:Gfo/Idh/MocA family oxidoreductase [Sphaerochaetaceae bacterium]MDX9940248.1 Gfo/Idh/MocA family oxidoreductase [Sphaerochaetaceae bacterium]